MPPLNLAKKLKPDRKALKSFTSKIKSKLHNFNVPNSIKAATHRLLEFCSLRLFSSFKKRFLSKYSSSRPHRYNYNDLRHYQHYQSQLHKNGKVIYIDQLYAEPMPMSMQSKRVEAPAETSRRNEVADDKALPRKGKEEEKEQSNIYSIEDAWKVVVAKSPHLRGVDERADEFIYKFHEDRKLEKERSDLDFHEMLARSA